MTLRILHVVPSIDPILGGVAESIRVRGLELTRLGHTVEVVSLDEPGSDVANNFELQLHPLGKGFSKWNYSRKLYSWLSENAGRYDAVVVDGLWQYQCYAVRAALKNSGIPYFVFPHGMLDPWFKKNSKLKHLKKWLFWPWCEYRLLKNAQAVLFTCEEERRLAGQSFGLYTANEIVVPFGTSAPPSNGGDLSKAFLVEHPELNKKQLVLYLGRIHPKKGCDIAIKAFANLAELYPDAVLAIAGAGDQVYVKKLKSLISGLGIEEKIVWLGMLKGDSKWGAMYAARCFVLPSHQENFGIAVVEALACGKPVVISNKVNIWKEVESSFAGFVGEDDVVDTEVNLNKVLSMQREGYASMADAALSVYRRRFSVSAMAAGMIDAVNIYKNGGACE